LEIKESKRGSGTGRKQKLEKELEDDIQPEDEYQAS